MRPLLIVVVALAVAAAGVACGDDAPPATIDDARFVRRANAVCAPAVPGLRAPDRRSPDSTEVTGRRLDEVAEGLAEVAAQLRRLPVAPAAAARVDAWLDDWDRFVVVGREYADAVRDDDPERYSAIDDEAVRLARRMGRFARGNGIDDCVL